MTGKEILNGCLARLGYSAEVSGQELYKDLLVRAVHIINDIYCDLYTITEDSAFLPISQLNEQINLKKECYPALIYGVCAALAAAAEDAEKHNFWASLYLSKRTSFSKICLKKDVF